MVLIKKKKQKSPEELEQERQQKDLQKAGIQDEFQAKGFELVVWMQNHRSKIMASIAVVLLIGLAYSGWLVFSRSSSEEASAEYQAALKLLGEETPSIKEDRPKIEAARTAFDAIAKKYARSDVGQLATLYSAHLSVRLNESDKAIAGYQAFLNAASRGNNLRALALSGLAYAYEANKNPQKSLETFEEIANSKLDVNSDGILWEMARLAKITGALEKARQNAEALMERYPDSPFLTNAENLLASLPESKAANQ